MLISRVATSRYDQALSAQLEVRAPGGVVCTIRWYERGRWHLLGEEVLGGSARSWRRLLNLEAQPDDSLLSQLWLAGDNLGRIAAHLVHAQQMPLAGRGATYELRSLPLFVSTSGDAAVEPWAWFVCGAMSAADPAGTGFELVTVPRRKGSPGVTDLAQLLPINVACGPRLADELRQARGYLNDESVKESGMQLRECAEVLPDNENCAVVIGLASGAHNDATLQHWLAEPPGSVKLRILLGARGTVTAGKTLPAGLAVIVVPELSRPQVTVAIDLLEEIIHDRPLHEGVALLRRQMPKPRGRSLPERLAAWREGPRLFADLHSNQALRISPAVPALLRQAEQVYTMALKSNLADFGRRAVLRGGPAVAAKLWSLFGGRAELAPAARGAGLNAALSVDTEIVEQAKATMAAKTFREGMAQGIDFRHERDGLVPLSRVTSATARLQARHATLARDAAQLMQQPDVAQLLEETQQRKVDAQLFEVRHGEMPRPIGRREILESGRTVRLEIHIGHRERNSLIVGEAPALDPLLPPLDDDDGHDLDIVVFPQDFRLVPGEPATRTVRLPRFGGTAPVSFDLRVPLQRGGESPTSSRASPRFNARGRGLVEGNEAQLRFAVYHGNQLLQSFMLRAGIGKESAVSERAQLSIRCDFSQTRRFGGLDRLGERVFNFALNRGTDGTHSLMLKGSGGKPLTIDWTEGQMSELAGEMREQMWKALFRAPRRERFEFDPQTLGLLTPPGAEFDNVVRQLATQGARLYVRFRMDSGVAADFLRNVRAADAGTLQFVLHDPKFSFPWPLIYDYSPEVVAKSPSLPVCRGVDGGGARCTCTPDSGLTICLRGFWGFRFVLEQLSSAPPPDENVAGFIAPSATSPTIGLARAVSDVYADTLPGLWPAPPRATSSEFTDDQPLLPLLETPQQRPAVVVWLGHQVNSGSAHAPWPELRSAKNTIVLDLGDIDAAVQRCEPNGWGPPRPIVLLLGCGTAAARADLGIGLAAALLKLGAIGVLGTEIEITTSIVTRVARDLVEKLVAGQCVGDALKETIWKLAQDGCPLGLAFTYLGRVEARLPS